MDNVESGTNLVQQSYARVTKSTALVQGSVASWQDVSCRAVVGALPAAFALAFAALSPCSLQNRLPLRGL